jgi:hypothetical protein
VPFVQNGYRKNKKRIYGPESFKIFFESLETLLTFLNKQALLSNIFCLVRVAVLMSMTVKVFTFSTHIPEGFCIGLFHEAGGSEKMII